MKMINLNDKDENIKLILLKPASELLKYLSKETREMVLQKIHASIAYLRQKCINLPQGVIFEYHTPFDINLLYTYLAFWDRRGNRKFVIIASHGFCRVQDHHVRDYRSLEIEQLANAYFTSIDNEQISSL